MGKSKISWCDWTWSPIHGCSPVSRGCDNCWARAMAPRLEGDFKITFHEDRLEEPIRMKKPRRIFVVPRGDLFHPNVLFETQVKILDVIAEANHHVFYVLTKRPGLMQMAVSDYLTQMPAMQYARLGGNVARMLRHVWWGVSVEGQDEWLTRIPELLQMEDDLNLFVSMEPMLERIEMIPTGCLDRIGWMILGGESGPEHRPMELEWVREIRNVCRERKIPFFFKQSSGRFPEQGKELDGEIWEQYPFEW